MTKAVARAIQIKVTPQERSLLATPRAVNPEALFHIELSDLHISKEEDSVKPWCD
jgi:hypothetical protein